MIDTSPSPIVSAPAWHVAERSNEIRWLGKNGTTTEPRRLQQKVRMELRDHSDRVLREAWQWRDIPLELED
jgi:hypothetical protein